MKRAGLPVCTLLWWEALRWFREMKTDRERNQVTAHSVSTIMERTLEIQLLKLILRDFNLFLARLKIEKQIGWGTTQPSTVKVNMSQKQSLNQWTLPLLHQLCSSSHRLVIMKFRIKTKLRRTQPGQHHRKLEVDQSLASSRVASLRTTKLWHLKCNRLILQSRIYSSRSMAPLR